MRTLYFQQITDDRFEDDIENRLIERNKLLRERLNVPGILSLDITEPRLVRFTRVTIDGERKFENQFRSDCRITKDERIT